MNVATYGPKGRFAMTDRGRAALRQNETTLEIGPSTMAWRDGQLVIDVNEIAGPPMVGRVCGRITLTPSAVTSVELALTPDGAHVWRPFAPAARIEVDLPKPGLSWSGHGYFDANFGLRALETDFDAWTWGRYPAAGGTTCFYDATRRDGSVLAAGIQFDGAGHADWVDPAPLAPLPRNIWALRRETRADPGVRPRVRLPMLDAPFYSRAAVETQLAGEPTLGVFEALDLARFRSPLLKPMLAVRVPRRPGWRFS